MKQVYETMTVLEDRLARPVRRLCEVTEGFRSDVFSLCLLSALVLLSWVPRMEGPLDLRWDGASYYVLGTSLADGKGYRLLNEPGEIEAVQYPPLLPAVIAGHQLLLGTDDPVMVGRALRVTFFVIYLAYVLGTYMLGKLFLPPLYALGAALAVVLNLFTNFLSDLCFAEMPFALVGVLFVLSSRQQGRFFAFLTPLLGIAAYLLRTVGIALLLAWIAEALVRLRFRTAAIRAVVALIPVVAWHGYIYSVESSPAYQRPAYPYQRAEYLFYNVSYSRNVSLRDPFAPELGRLSASELVERFLGHLVAMPWSMGEGLSAKVWYWRRHLTTMVSPIETLPGVWRIPTYFPDLVLPILGLFILIGAVLLAREGEALIPLYLLLVLAALCLTPWDVQWPRYWAPVAPFLALGLFRAVWAVMRTARSENWLSRIPRATVAALVGLLFFFQGFTLYFAYAKQMGDATYLDRRGESVSARLFFYRNEGYRELDAGLDWLRAHAAPTDVVAASMPPWVYVRTGLKTVMPPFERDPDKMQALLDSVPVTWVVVDATPINFARDYALPVLKDSPDRWSRVYVLDGTTPTGDGGVFEIYRRIKEDTAAQRQG